MSIVIYPPVHAFNLFLHFAINGSISHLGHQRQTIDQFLNKLPSTVIKNGRVVDIKSDLRDALKVHRYFQIRERFAMKVFVYIM